MTKKLYIYTYLDRCDPASSSYHEGGGLVVVTSGYPNDAVKTGTGNRYTVAKGGEEYVKFGPPEGDEYVKFGLPEPDHVYVVADDAPDTVIVFPDAGCC